MKIQLLGHYYAGNNMGDEAIHRQVKADIESIDPFVEFTHDPVRPDIFILGGGGMYSDWQKDALDTWLPPIEAALRNEVPTIAYGVGIGPLFWPGTTERLRKVFNAIDLVMVRDNASKEALGLNKAIVTADPAIRYGYRYPVVGLNLVDIKTICMLDGFFQDLVRLILSYCDLKFFCLWPPHKALYDRIMRYLAIEIPVIDAWNPDVFKEEVCKVDIWMGMQYHGLIFANMNHKDCIALNYHHKCVEYSNEMKIPGTLISDSQNIRHYPLEKSLMDIRNILELKFSSKNNIYQASDMNRRLLEKFIGGMKK